MKRIPILLLLILLISSDAFSDSKRNKRAHLILKSNLMAITLMTELNLYVETINVKTKKGFEFGVSYHSPENFVIMSYSSFGFNRTRTSGGPYGLGSVGTPMFVAGHKGYSCTVNYKLYRSNFQKFYGPQIVFAYRELLNGYYTDHDDEGPGYSQGYYWYTANHYSKKFALLANFGRTGGIGKRYPIEMGGAIGINFSIDNLQLLKWGAHIQNADPNFVNYDKMKPTKHTDGLYLTPALRLYFKVGIDFRK